MATGDGPGALRVALLGIDGSGKSTIARLLAGRAAAGRRHVVLSCLRPHEHPDAPLHGLSRHLDELSGHADRLGSPELKLAVLYLQMCTYATAERFFTRELGAGVVITERHPVVDALVYLPLYRRAVERDGGPRGPAALRGLVAAMPAAAVEAARAWAQVLGRRPGGRAARLDTLGAELIGLLNLPAAARTAELSARFGVAAPDVAVLLDIDAAEALRRVAARDGRPEMHERADLLAGIRDGYGLALAGLGGVRTHRIAAAGRPAADMADEVARLAGL